ncbi:glycerophosphodiester phosphodiesterase family protein [Mycoplasmopsis synoviae]|nr:glycerophosphodiester phosphodiesterase family protein [Mycoplasmopsis synoviae]AKB10810.1 glycerophosphodiester phosphodiesterase [Mycoplasmopsis synoviae ATCC 25204]
MENKYILGHRGYFDKAPENTKLAFDLALKHNFDGVELDIHLTKNNKIVIIHDESILRTTGVDLEVYKNNYEDLKDYNYAFYFKNKVEKQSLMLLEDFLDLYFDKFKIINIEIKTDKIHYLNIEKLLYDLVSEYLNFENKIVFSSFNFQSLILLKKINPNLKLGYLFDSMESLLKIEKDLILNTCNFLHPSWKLYLKNKKELISYNLPLNLWTIRCFDKLKMFYKDSDINFLISNKKLPNSK